MSQSLGTEEDYAEFFKLWNPAIEPDTLTEAARNKIADAAEKLWKAAVRPPPPATNPAVSAATAALNLERGAALFRNTAVEIGRTKLTESERWKLQAAMRREAPGSKEYNKKLLRATSMTKGPVVGEGFPPGRGRPQR